MTIRSSIPNGYGRPRASKDSWFANYKSQFGLASDYYREKKWKFMGQSSIEIGIFAVGTGRWELDNDAPDVKRKNIQLAVGFGATACYEYSWTISYPIGPVPAYVCFTLGVSAGVSIQFTIDLTWANGGFEYWRVYPIDEVTYSISFYFAAQVGLGVKGFLEAWVRFIASLDVSISLVLFGLDKCSTVVSAGYELSTGLTVFFVSFRKTWLSKEKIIYSSIPADNSLLTHYMNAEKNAEKVVEAAHLDPQSNPDLTPETGTILPLRNAKASFKVLNAGGRDYLFFLTQDKDKSGKSHWRVKWRDAKDAQNTGTTQATKRSNKVLGIELFGTFGRLAYAEDEPAYGVTSFEMISGKGVKCFNDKYVQSGMGKNYVRTLVRGAMRCSDTEPKLYHRAGNNELNSPSFVALSQPLSGVGDRAIEVFDFEMNSVNDMNGREAVVVAKGDIQHFELAQTAVDGDGTNYRRVIFYTEKETNDEGLEQCRLYGLYLEPVVRDTYGITFTVTKYAYDLVIPGGKFNLAYMGETPYVYWASAVPDPDEKDRNKWRVWTVAYDMSTNAMTDASVFAEFSLPQYKTTIPGYRYQKTIEIKDTVIHNLMLIGGGTSYFSIVPRELTNNQKVDLPSPMALCRFSELLKPVVELWAAITQAPAVSAGSFEDISLALMNEGNMGVAAFDIAMYEVTNGQEGKDPVETVHVNCLDPEKSKITMQSGKVELTGKKVGHRAEDFDYTARQRDWVLSQEKKEYRIRAFGSYNEVESVTTVDSDAQYVKSEVLMSGSIGVYNTAFLIPEAWRGKKTLRLKVSQMIAQPEGEINHGALLEMCEGMCGQYTGADFGDFDLGELLGTILGGLRDEHFKIDPFITNLARGITAVEGTIKTLSPKVNILNYFTSKVNTGLNFNINMEHPEEMNPEIAMKLLQLANGIIDSTVKTAETLDMLEKGQLKVRTDFSFEEKALNAVSRIMGYVIRALIIVALIISSGLLCTTSALTPDKVVGAVAFRAVGICGFIVSLFFAQRLFREMKNGK